MEDSDLNFLGKEIFGFEGDEGIMAAFLGSTEGAKLWKDIGESLLAEGRVEEETVPGQDSGSAGV